MRSIANPARILVATTTDADRRPLEHVLADAAYEVSAVTCRNVPTESVRELTPDLLLLGRRVLGKTRFTALERLRSWYRGPILMLVQMGRPDAVVEAIRAGAHDCIFQPIRPLELLARVQALLSLGPPVPTRPALIRAGQLVLDLTLRRAVVLGREVELTATQFDILAFLARRPNVLVSQKEIAANVLGVEFGYGGSLRVHIGRIRKKIEPDPSKPRYLLTQRGVGYVFQIDPRGV